MERMTNTHASLEKEFLDTLKKNTLILQIGNRHSGKTTWACCLLYHLIAHDDFYQEFHLVLPTYSNQAGGTFDWIDRLPEKRKKKVTIYEDFSLVIIDQLIEQSDGKKNRFFYVDDATSETQLHSNDETIKSLTSKARHFKITTLLCFHFLKLRNALLRNSAEWLFLHRTTDAKLIEGVYEESASLYHDKNTFYTNVREEMAKDFPCMAVWRDRGWIDFGNPMDWSFNKYRDKVLGKGISKQKHAASKKDTLETEREQTDPAFGRSEPELQEDKSEQNPFQTSFRLVRKNKIPPRIPFRF
jgi:hypothetical protein